MNIQEEKQLIFNQMSNIKEQRDELTDIYDYLQQRLTELHRQERGETKPLQQTIRPSSPEDLQSLLPEYREEEPSFVEPTELEPLALIEEAEEEEPKIEKSLPVKKEKSPPKKGENVSPIYISREDEISKAKNSRSKGVYLSIESAKLLVENVLQRSGEPLSTPELLKRLNKQTDYDITLSNFRSSMLPKVISRSDHAKRHSYGKYHYVY